MDNDGEGTAGDSVSVTFVSKMAIHVLLLSFIVQLHLTVFFYI
jgi:hypothetical protein